MTLGIIRAELECPGQSLLDPLVPVTRTSVPTTEVQSLNLPPPLGVAQFEALNSIAHIFPIVIDPPNIPPFDYNDDIYCEHYEGALVSYMSFQRNRIVIDNLDASTREEFVDKAMDRPSPFAEVSPIPSDIRRSINFLSSNSPETIRSFWKRQMGHLKSLISERQDRSNAWYASAPPELHKFHRRFPLGVWAAIMHFCGLGGSRWLAQFVYGFPITGKLSQKFAFPATTEKLSPTLSTADVLLSAPSRFARRSAHVSPAAQGLWDEALQQVEAGWLDPPRRLSNSGKVVDCPSSPLNVAFRFAVAQDSKVRACDDLKESLTNKMCAVTTPITLPDWDLLAAMHLLIAASSKADWAFLKGDDTSAYKNLPLKPTDAPLAAIGLFDPSRNSWFALLPRTLIFGATASVLHYNILSRIVAVIINRLFGIPLIAFYDDLGSPIPFELGEEALQLVTEVCRCLGMILNYKKCLWGNPLSFLGLTGYFPTMQNNWQLSITLTEDKIAKWPAQISHFLTEGKIMHAELHKLIGKLSFAQSMVFGKCARSFLRPLYTWLHSDYFSPCISDQIAEILRWWIRLLRSFRPRIVTFCPKFPSFVIFTDASFKDGVGKVAAFLFHRDSFRSNGKAAAMASLEVPAKVLAYFSDTLPIFALEFFAITLAVFEWETLIRDCSTTLYTDNTGAFGAVLNTGSTSRSVSNVTMRLWYMIAQFSIRIWFEPVSSPLNIADLPTRDKPSPFAIDSISSFSLFEEAFTFFTQMSISRLLKYFDDQSDTTFSRDSP